MTGITFNHPDTGETVTLNPGEGLETSFGRFAYIEFGSMGMDIPEAPEQTEEERIQFNLWDGARIAAEIEGLIVTRAQLRAALAVSEAHEGRKIEEVAAEHPLTIAINARIAELREQLVILI
jgi:hypothetical protein